MSKGIPRGLTYEEVIDNIEIGKVEMADDARHGGRLHDQQGIGVSGRHSPN